MVKVLGHSHTLFEIREPKFPEKNDFSRNFDLKPSLEFYQGWVYSKTLVHSTENWLTKHPASFKSSQIFSLYRKWYNHASKVTKITTYAISSDVIGHDDRLKSDISLKRYGPKLCVPEVIYLKNDSIRICRHFFESLSSLKFTKMSPKSRVPLRMVPTHPYSGISFRTCAC